MGHENHNKNDVDLQEIIPIDDNDDIKVLWDPEEKASDASLKLQLIYDQVRPGHIVWAPEAGSKDPWRAATVDKIEDTYSKFIATIKYSMEDFYTEKGVRRKTFTRTTAKLSLKHLAYYEEKPGICAVIPKGIRVIAKTTISHAYGNRYFSGIIAEIPTIVNKNRYLVFFDTGDAVYIPPRYVRMICLHEVNPWADMHPDVQLFIRDYFNKAPDYPLAKRTRKFSIIQVEWNGMWWSARVEEVDCVLIKVILLENSLTFWLYRGSPRILENNKTAQREIKEYRRKIESGVTDVKPLPYSAEYEGKIERHQVPKEYARLATILDPSHTCSRSCSPRFPKHISTLKGVSPLVIPYYYGWDRGIDAVRKIVYYRTPCGRKLENILEIRKFIKETSSELQIDTFCFDVDADCLAVFKPFAEPFIYEQDISDGSEYGACVERVNAVDNLIAPPFVYSPKNFIDDSVKRDDSDEFLAGCDCEDDCSDRSNCSCCRLTSENEPRESNGLARFGPDTDGFGYDNKRLFYEYVSGLYECNKNCKCSAACLNKVVQQGLRFRLQVFKTSKKGYAIRAMQDIPCGAFLCVYTGMLMNGEAANIAGSAHGDDYLANLDLIEHYGYYKPGYEHTAIEPDYPTSNEGKKSQDSDKDSSSSSSSSVGKEIALLHISPPAPGTARKSGCSASEGSKMKRKRDDDKSPTTKNSHGDITNKKTDKKTRDERVVLFGPGEEIYVIDSMEIGNLSRYMNHSCDPNVWAQNVFDETHDLRFPSCAFFASKFIKCGTELTWNYNYKVGSVEGKRIDCNCGAALCKGRLL